MPAKFVIEINSGIAVVGKECDYSRTSDGSGRNDVAVEELKKTTDGYEDGE